MLIRIVAGKCHGHGGPLAPVLDRRQHHLRPVTNPNAREDAPVLKHHLEQYLFRISLCDALHLQM